VGRIIDVICLLSLLLLGLLLHSEIMLQYFEENLNLDVTALIVLALIGLLGLGIAILFYRRLSNSNSNSDLFIKVKKVVDGFVEGLSSLKSVSNIPLFVAYSVGICGSDFYPLARQHISRLVSHYFALILPH